MNAADMSEDTDSIFAPLLFNLGQNFFKESIPLPSPNKYNGTTFNMSTTIVR